MAELRYSAGVVPSTAEEARHVALVRETAVGGHDLERDVTTLSMAFVAPAIVKAAIEGRLPRGIGVAQLRDAPPAWSKQFRQLGLPPL